MKLLMLSVAFGLFLSTTAYSAEYAWKCSRPVGYQLSNGGHFDGATDTKLLADADGSYSLVEDYSAPAEQSLSRRILVSGVSCVFSKEDKAIFECSAKKPLTEKDSTGCGSSRAKCIVIGMKVDPVATSSDTTISTMRFVRTQLKYKSDELQSDSVVKISGYTYERPGIKTTWQYAEEFQASNCTVE